MPFMSCVPCIIRWLCWATSGMLKAARSKASNAPFANKLFTVFMISLLYCISSKEFSSPEFSLIGNLYRSRCSQSGLFEGGQKPKSRILELRMPQHVPVQPQIVLKEFHDVAHWNRQIHRVRFFFVNTTERDHSQMMMRRQNGSPFS